MSLIEEVMRRAAHERTAAMPGPVVTNVRATSRPSLAPTPPLPENYAPVQYRPAPVDPQAMERNRVLLRVPDVGISRAYKILRTRVLHRLAANNWFTLGITGTMAGEGKSLTSVVVAESVDQTVRGSRDIRRVLDMAPLGVIPQIQDAVTARRQRWRMAALTACVVVASTAAVMTARMFY